MEILGSIAGPVIGGLLGGQGSSQQQTQQQQLDPRVRQSILGSGGVFDNADQYRLSQLATGGLNQNQTAGLEMQRQVLTSPSYTQGYDQMRNLGSSLLGGGVASNPYTQRGGMPSMGGASSAQQPGGFSYAPGTVNTQAVGTMPTTQAAPMQQPAQEDELTRLMREIERQRNTGSLYTNAGQYGAAGG